MSKIGLPLTIFVMSILYIFFIPVEPIALKVLFKLIPMWLMLLYAYVQIPGVKRPPHWLIIIGLFFCMLGDGFIGFSFVLGLTAFLVGHLFYLSSFFQMWRFSKVRFFMLIPILFYAMFMGWRFYQALHNGDDPGLIIPVLLYILVISAMAWSAMMTGHRWLILGSLLFMCSDSILAWDLFISQVKYSSELIMITYYGAQFFIAYNMSKLNLSQATTHTLAK